MKDMLMSDPQSANRQAARPERKGSLLRTVKAVAWSFVGLRRRGDFEEDTAQLSPLHIIFVGIAGAAVFVGALILLVRWVVAP